MNKSESDTLSSSSESKKTSSTSNGLSAQASAQQQPPSRRTVLKQNIFKFMNQINIIKTDPEKGKDENGDDVSTASTATGQSSVSVVPTIVSDVYKNGELARSREKKKLAKHKIEGWLGSHKPYTEYLEYLSYEEYKASLSGSSASEISKLSPAIEINDKSTLTRNRNSRELDQTEQSTDDDRSLDTDDPYDDADELEPRSGSTGELDKNGDEDFQKLLQMKRPTAPSQQTLIRRQLDKDPEFRNKLRKFTRFKIVDVDVEFESDFLGDLNQINPLEIIDINNEYICYTNKFYQMNHFNFIGKYEYEKSRKTSTSKNSADSLEESDLDDSDMYWSAYQDFSKKPAKRSSLELESNHPIFVLSLHSESNNQVECILRTRSGNKIGTVDLPEGESWNVTNILSRLDKNMFIKEIKPVIHPQATELIAKFDNRLIKPNFTFGIVYQKLGQTDEKEIFNNNSHSPEFEEFLEFIGRKVELKDFQGFRGGLDKANNTGEYSIYEEFSNSEIMFHVSTMLPYSARDTQQIERKRHIGNDRVCIVFQDEYTPFTPEMLPTNLLHVFLVIQPGKLEDGSRCYQLTVISKSDVPDIEPFIRKPYLFKKDENLKKFLLTKLINSEYASLKAKAFSKFQIKTMDIWLKELYANLKKLTQEFTGEDFASTGNVEKQLVNSIGSIVSQQQQFLTVVSGNTNKVSPSSSMISESPSAASSSLNAAFSMYSLKQQYLIIKNLESIFKQHLQNNPGEFETLAEQGVISPGPESKSNKFAYGKPKSNIRKRLGDAFSFNTSSKSSYKNAESESTHSMESFETASSSAGYSSATQLSQMSSANSASSAPNAGMLSDSNLYKAPIFRSKTKGSKADEEANQVKRSTLTADSDDAHLAPPPAAMSASMTHESSGQKKEKDNLKKFTNIMLSNERYQVADKKKVASNETLKKPTTLNNLLSNASHKPVSTVKSVFPKPGSSHDIGDTNNETGPSDSEQEITVQEKEPTSPQPTGPKAITDLFKRIGRKRDDQHQKLSESSSSQRRRRSFEYEEQVPSTKNGDQLKTKF